MQTIVEKKKTFETSWARY